MEQFLLSNPCPAINLLKPLGCDKHLNGCVFLATDTMTCLDFSYRGIKSFSAYVMVKVRSAGIPRINWLMCETTKRFDPK